MPGCSIGWLPGTLFTPIATISKPSKCRMPDVPTIPTKGNTFNRKEKIALGNREDDDEYVKKDCGDDKATANMVTYDIKSCLADFKARVKVK